MSPPTTRRRIPAPLRISLLYTAFGLLWIGVGDALVWLQGDVSRQGLLLGLAKGILFVLVSAALIYLLVRRDVARRDRVTSQLTTVLDLAPVGIVALDADRRISRWNTAAEQILGWTEDEVIGRDVASLGLAPSERTTSSVVPDLVVRARDGSQVSIRIFSSPAGRAADGSTVLVFRDRRPQMAMEAALRQAHKLEAVGRLAGGVAHEFNNILTAIIGHSVLLLERLDAGDDGRDNVAELRRAADRAAGLTRQLLVVSGRQVTRPATIDLGLMLHDMRGIAARVAGDDITIEIAAGDSLWPVRGDIAQLQQLVLNLVVNAREAMNDAGTITLSAANLPHDAPRTSPDPLPPGDFVLLRVSDTGHGMSPETLAHVFEPFFTTKEQSTGLGLATVYGIVQQSDGHIRVRSEPGRGATFEIYLPRSTAAETLPAPAMPTTSAAARLLVVEDDDAVRDLTCRVLKRGGHQVTSARNGHEALTMLAGDADYSLVIADVVMPGMNGFELGDRIRSAHPGLPILYTSGYVAAAAAESRALEAGTFFLEKPFRPDELLARVSLLLVQDRDGPP